MKLTILLNVCLFLLFSGILITGSANAGDFCPKEKIVEWKWGLQYFDYKDGLTYTKPLNSIRDYICGQADNPKPFTGKYIEYKCKRYFDICFLYGISPKAEKLFEINYKNGERVGTSLFYRMDGSIFLKTNYADNLLESFETPYTKLNNYILSCVENEEFETGGWKDMLTSMCLTSALNTFDWAGSNSTFYKNTTGKTISLD